MVDINKWKEINKQYETAFKQKSEESKARNFKVKFDIMEWDETHYRQGKGKEFKFQFLKELMVWKMRRGHYRPTLEPLIWKNKESDVNKVLKEAHDQVKTFEDKEWNVVDLRKVTDKLSELSGVGVATASAILSIMDNRIPFMGDEATELILSQSGSKKKLTYTWSTYRTYYEGIVKLADSLRKLDDDKESEITPKFCEQAIFAAHWLNLELPLDNSLFDGDDSNDKEEIEPPKKQKKITRVKSKAK